MKFWQLISIMASERAVIDAVLAKPEWRTYQSWYVNFDTLVAM